MSFRDDYRQAFREARANGRIGYRVLRNPKARMAAAETMRLRLDRDGLTRFRYEFACHPGWERMAAPPPEAPCDGSARRSLRPRNSLITTNPRKEEIMLTNTKTIDPRTTRRRVRFMDYERNSALYAQYKVIGHEVDPITAKVQFVVLQKKEEFCIRK